MTELITAERQMRYQAAFCIVMIYSALSMDSFENAKFKIDEAMRIFSDNNMGREMPPIVSHNRIPIRDTNQRKNSLKSQIIPPFYYH